MSSGPRRRPTIAPPIVISPPSIVPGPPPAPIAAASASGGESSASANTTPVGLTGDIDESRVVSENGLNDIQRRIAHIVGTQLAETEKQQLIIARSSSEKLTSLWQKVARSQVRRDAELGDAGAVAQLTQLQAQATAAHAAVAAIEQKLAMAEASELQGFVNKVLEVERQPLSDSADQGRGFSNTGGEIARQGRYTLNATPPR